MSTFFTSDTHFGDSNIIKKHHDRERFSDIKHHDETIITMWNNTVTPDDTVYHLGDVSARTTIEYSLECVSQLKGNIIILAGNHDPFWKRHNDNHNDNWEYYKNLYEELDNVKIVESGRMNTTIADHEFVLSHLPYACSDRTLFPGFPTNLISDSISPAEHRPIICGHVHGKWRNYKRAYNVGLDVNNFQLVTEDKIRFALHHWLLNN